MTADLPISFADVAEAAIRIEGHVHHTPVLRSRRLDDILGARLAFKCENFQRIGAFKARGAHNAVLALDAAAAARGVVTHSSGNHAAALSLAAATRGVPAYIVMPENAPRAKVDSVLRLGGQVEFCAPTIAAREAAAAAIVAARGATLVHPYDDPMVIAGQGTAAMELLDAAGPLDAILAPVGGGGLMSGTAVAARTLQPSIRIIATEPAQADDAWRSWKAGERVAGDPPDTIADGLRTTLGANGFLILSALLDDFVTVSEAAIVEAMRLVWEVLKIVIEPSSAVPVAALIEGKVDVKGAEVGVILTGGNVDLDRLPWQKGL
ncbi:MULTISPECIES: threonine ammonia-lyase [Sphingomonadales]|uniref:Serine/threonine dehydratase n=2 Tax=Edaphosphingomonas TaxID=3423724 RepID=A0A2T4HJU3_9SPHN|nr:MULTISPECIES: pyridoxal-phosphate dependent enzyme [Sphingomonas]AGH49381.1 pyridoxal-5'-phosphate-dependent protein subunit beta [Sphingomonas sp. MM-1]MDX3885934.1 pyridoxal-phosphate dependent enzyme [Sphingomonas sp.]OHT22018.1 L-threonine dehydratase catabolic TdcB [Sphingomonas haloaromaticamans]PTD16047.1 serine/threonine dehydratase [Sphingomonas fennica]